MLKAILIVTLLSLNLQTTEDAYTKFLGYQLVERGTVTKPLAQSWGAEKMVGQPYLLMQPESQSKVLLRFIESGHTNDYKPMLQEGWNAIEILVKDPDLLAEQLQGSPFKMVGPPNFLTEKKNIRAFQALGPNNELLYFTRVIDPSKSNFDLGQAKSFVDQVFIMVLGGKDMAAMQHFYREKLMQPVSGPYPYRIGVLSQTYGMPNDTLHQLAIASLPNQFLIEIDQYPPAAKSIDTMKGTLPPGIAMVSFQVDHLGDTRLPFITPPDHRDGFAYEGRRSASLRGAAGELIELIETPLLSFIPDENSQD